jgi:hypothetical protein
VILVNGQVACYGSVAASRIESAVAQAIGASEVNIERPKHHP